MKKCSKTATIISIGLIAFGIFMFFVILPFLYLYIGIIEEGKTGIKNLKWNKLAVKYAIMTPQKEFAINSALPSLILSKDFDTTITYVKELEKLNKANDMHYYFASFALMKKQEYQQSLEYAKKSNNKGMITRAYLNLGEIKKAEQILNDLKKEKPYPTRAHMYKAEIEMSKGNYKLANSEIDKMLKSYPKSLEALQDKAKISKKLGNIKEYKKAIKQIKEIELRQSNRIK